MTFHFYLLFEEYALLCSQIQFSQIHIFTIILLNMYFAGVL